MEAVNWRIENETLILTCTDVTGKKIDVTIPPDILKEIIIHAPPTEAKHIRELIKMIRRIRKEQLLEIEEIAKENKKLLQEDEQARQALMNKNQTTNKTEVNRWSAVIRAVASKKALLQERRHLAKLLDNKEAELRVKLIKLMRGQEEF